MTKIKNNTVLVTGGNRGIGKALVEALLERGASKVYAAARNTDSLKELADKHGDRLVPVKLDVTNPDQVKAAAEVAGDTAIVINNAGFLGNPDLFGESLEASRQEFEVNYWGTLNVIRAFSPVLKTNGGGAIVNISSIGGLTNFPMFPTYSDSKAASHSLTTGARILLAEQGTHVAGVYPGPVDTDMAREVEFEKATPESVAKAILDGLEKGETDIFPDPMAEGFRGSHEAGAKVHESQIIQMLQPA
jgi:NAD(P)-dependent dehydrogenase (short-subunit alcohol dehydrogenase family)